MISKKNDHYREHGVQDACATGERWDDSDTDRNSNCSKSNADSLHKSLYARSCLEPDTIMGYISNYKRLEQHGSAASWSRATL